MRGTRVRSVYGNRGNTPQSALLHKPSIECAKDPCGEKKRTLHQKHKTTADIARAHEHAGARCGRCLDLI